jgi:hypothetical protein
MRGSDSGFLFMARFRRRMYCKDASLRISVGKLTKRRDARMHLYTRRMLALNSF